MKHILLLALLLTTTLFASTEAILKLDTKAHTGIIQDIIVTKSGDIISASDDKTIRVLDSKTGLEKSKILGQIGNGSEGKIYAIALSNDEKYLAVGGFLDKPANSGDIRIYNYQTKQLLKILKSHTNIVNDLAFSKDGRYLISGSSDKSAKIWDVKNSFKLKDTIKFHTRAVYGVKIVKKNSRCFAVTAGDDNKIALYDIQKRKIITSHKSNSMLSYLATNSKKQHIAVCGTGREVKIYDFSLHLLKTIQSETMPTGLAYNKEFLIAGTGDYPCNVNIYKIANNYKLYSSFKKHTNLTMAVAFLDNHTAISGGGNNSEIYVWDIKSKKIKTKIEGVGERILSVGIDGDEIAWGNKWTGDSHTVGSKFQKSINLKTFKISTNISKKHFNRIKTTHNSYTLSHSQGGEYGYGDGVLNIKKSGVIKSSIVKSSTNGLGHNCYGFYKNYIISGGASGHLKIYNLEGKEIASLVGHTGTIWSIAVDGDRLVSGSDDQSVKVWDLKKINQELKIDENYLKDIIKATQWTRTEVIEKADFILEKTGQSIYKTSIFPILSLFISKDNEYIAWSKSGYFTSSAGGDKYVGYHINQGANREAKYVGSDKYFDTLYRPDIIGYIVQTGSEKKAIKFASRTRKVKTVDIASSLPPVVTLVGKDRVTTSKNSITIKYMLESKEPITKTVITINGKTLSKRALKRKKSGNSKTVTIELEDGENIIAIKARNRFAFSDEVLVYVTKKSRRKTIFKPTLYLLSIGVSKYKNSEYNLGLADKDAKSITAMFKKQQGKIYKKVVTKTLLNDNAISDNIFDALDWIEREVTSKDVAIIFIAGHGVNDDKGNYYFLSHDANLDRLRRTSVKWAEIQDTTSNLPSKVILLADTCHSGGITGKRRDITSAVKSIMNSGSGSIIMTATTGSGYSYEQKSWGHGAFTKAILEGLGKAKADYNEDRTISIKEIDLYVTDRVKKLTKGKQKPTTIIPNSVPDFALGVK